LDSLEDEAVGPRRTLPKALCASADRNLMRPFPADLMRMWPISTRVNKPENDDSSIIEPIELESA
jgi:putative SOS response-associated peptidase YedK